MPMPHDLVPSRHGTRPRAGPRFACQARAHMAAAPSDSTVVRPPSAPPPAEIAPRDAAYLLVFGATGCQRVELPPSGRLVLGRGEGAEVLVADSAVSRLHARVSIVDGAARVEDLESQNGTFVNDERLVGGRPLAPSDVIRLGDTVVVYCAHGAGKAPRGEVVTFEALSARLEQECVRSRVSGRAFGLVAITSDEDADREAVQLVLRDTIPALAVAAWHTPRRLLVRVPAREAG